MPTNRTDTLNYLNNIIDFCISVIHEEKDDLRLYLTVFDDATLIQQIIRKNYREEITSKDLRNLFSSNKSIFSTVELPEDLIRKFHSSNIPKGKNAAKSVYNLNCLLNPQRTKTKEYDNIIVSKNFDIPDVAQIVELDLVDTEKLRNSVNDLMKQLRKREDMPAAFGQSVSLLRRVNHSFECGLNITSEMFSTWLSKDYKEIGNLVFTSKHSGIIEATKLKPFCKIPHRSKPVKQRASQFVPVSKTQQHSRSMEMIRNSVNELMKELNKRNDKLAAFGQSVSLMKRINNSVKHGLIITPEVLSIWLREDYKEIGFLVFGPTNFGIEAIQKIKLFCGTVQNLKPINSLPPQLDSFRTKEQIRNNKLIFLAHLRFVLFDPQQKWNKQGKGFYSKKMPTGIREMRNIFEKVGWKSNIDFNSVPRLDDVQIDKLFYGIYRLLKTKQSDAVNKNETPQYRLYKQKYLELLEITKRQDSFHPTQSLF